jgi:hypothetical protein
MGCKRSFLATVGNRFLISYRTARPTTRRAETQTNPGRHKLVIAYLSRQCGDRQLREWLTRRKAAYLETTFKTWEAAC